MGFANPQALRPQADRDAFLRDCHSDYRRADLSPK
jgi:hypothetical protein